MSYFRQENILLREATVQSGKLLFPQATRFAREMRSPLILTNTDGRPWTSDGFRTSCSRACARTGITDLTFHDLRGPAVVRLALDQGRRRRRSPPLPATASRTSRRSSPLTISAATCISLKQRR